MHDFFIWSSRGSIQQLWLWRLSPCIWRGWLKMDKEYRGGRGVLWLYGGYLCEISIGQNASEKDHQVIRNWAVSSAGGTPGAAWKSWGVREGGHRSAIQDSSPKAGGSELCVSKHQCWGHLHEPLHGWSQQISRVWQSVPRATRLFFHFLSSSSITEVSWDLGGFLARTLAPGNFLLCSNQNTNERHTPDILNTPFSFHKLYCFYVTCWEIHTWSHVTSCRVFFF